MATNQLMFAKMTDTANASYIGADGELLLLTPSRRLVVHDGVTAGGSTLAKLSDAVTPVIQTYTVAALPASASAGQMAFATNCRVFNGAGTQEGAGVGTGGLVTYNGTAWKIAGTNITAVA